MPKCSFCKKNYDIPRGLTFVLPNGELLHFCSSKCRKNNKLGRKGEKMGWVKKRKGAEVEMSSLEKTSEKDEEEKER